MTEREMDSGFELVLDNRKKILIFAVIIIVCGCFFVWGFMAGKRQGMQLSAIDGMGAAAVPGIENTAEPAAEGDEAAAEVSSLEEEDVQQDLDWYQSVSKKADEPVGIQPPRSSSPAEETSATASAPRSSVSSTAVAYSVQVGAFKGRPEAETHARNVRAKGFDSRVEPPETDGQLFLVKVGTYKTRAEAVAVQNRLKKSGFSCFVKTN